MIQLVIRLIVNAASLWIAALVIEGIEFHTDLLGIFMVALLFGVVNAFIKPLVERATCPFYVLTLGLFTFVVNALMLMLTSFFAGDAFVVAGFWPALFGSIVISVVSTVLSLFLKASSGSRKKRDEHS